MAGRVKRAHASDLKLAEINDWKVTEPRSKKAKRRRVTLVEPEEIETDEGSEEEEEMEISPQLVEPFAGEQSIAVQVQARGAFVRRLCRRCCLAMTSLCSNVVVEL